MGFFVGCVGATDRPVGSIGGAPAAAVAVRTNDDTPCVKPYGLLICDGCGGEPADSAVECRVVGDTIGPAAVDDPYPRAAKDAQRVLMIMAACLGAGVDSGRPWAGVSAVAAKVCIALLKRLLHDQRKPIEVCLPDCLVTGVCPASAATDSGPA